MRVINPTTLRLFPFVYNLENDTYTCPASETLTTNGTWHAHSSRGNKLSSKFQRYKTTKCKTCVLQSQCTKSNNGRNIDRSEYASLVEQNALRVNQNPNYYRQRQQLAEHPWGTLKRQRGFDHVLTRGKTKVLGEVSLVFIGYNLSRLANIVDGLEKIKALIYKCIRAANLLFGYNIAKNKARLSPIY